MAKRIAKSTLQASTLDILNVIRENASYAYQSSVPAVTTENDIPKVGEVLYGAPALLNEFTNALVNRIAFVRIQSMIFNNPYTDLKKGALEYGETIEEVFVGLVKGLPYSTEKAESREFKKYMANVKSAFHAINWKILYPITINRADARAAFVSAAGVEDLIMNVINQVYQSAQYDEFLLFKYLLIKRMSHGQVKAVSVGDGTKATDSAKAFRATSNKLLFPKTDYNAAGVQNNTPRERQAIFMDANFNAEFDVDVLASSFNMDKATFLGSLYLIDDWTSFDNERFEAIRAESDGLEEVTDAELALLADVKAVIVDKNWFQVYDAENTMTEKEVASGLYWNYFYHTWKVVSVSPFANAVMFVTSNATITLPDSVTATVASKSISGEAIVLTLAVAETATLKPSIVNFVQTGDLVEDGIAVDPYGAITVPIAKSATDITVKATIGTQGYTASADIAAGTVDVGDTITLAKDV